MYAARARLDGEELSGRFSIMELLEKIEGMVKKHGTEKEGKRR
jgi:hypothetical protein